MNIWPKILLLTLLLPTLVACERQTVERCRLVVTDQKWESSQAPVVFKIDTLTGETWVNGPHTDKEKWYKVEKAE